MAVERDPDGLPQMRLRPMEEADVAAVVEIEQRVYPFPWTAGIFSDCLRVGYRCAVLELDVVTVGYGIIACGAGEAHLLNVCVREEFRNRGLGRALMMHLLGLAASAGAAVVFLEVRPANTAAVRLYEALGFRQIGVRRGYYQAVSGREDALVMRRAIDAA
ncbi:MAG: ribosomal protein S18-alanine N-acetyltransferase [Proteobacteria bacterium]|nr:ribosomal protein S18-alanine N-acetyltransferase [Pseudomonadota bacterium]